MSKWLTKGLASAGIDLPMAPVPQSTWDPKARRPGVSALATDRVARRGGDRPDWRAGIAAYLADNSGSAGTP